MFFTRMCGNAQVNPADCSLIQGRMGRPKLPLTPGAEGLVLSALSASLLPCGLSALCTSKHAPCVFGSWQLRPQYGEGATMATAATSSLELNVGMRVPHQQLVPPPATLQGAS